MPLVASSRAGNATSQTIDESASHAVEPRLDEISIATCRERTSLDVNGEQADDREIAILMRALDSPFVKVVLVDVTDHLCDNMVSGKELDDVIGSHGCFRHLRHGRGSVDTTQDVNLMIPVVGILGVVDAMVKASIGLVKVIATIVHSMGRSVFVSRRDEHLAVDHR